MSDQDRIEKYEQIDNLKTLEALGIGNEEALRAFQKLANSYYDHNFGTMMKSEIDLIMFECFDESNKNKQGKSPAFCSDYEIARRLALTPQRVQNLRTKSALRRKDEENWLSALSHALQNKTYDLIDQKSKNGVQIQIMFSSQIDVFAFRDALMRHGFIFDGTFNNLIVATPLSALLYVLIKESDSNAKAEGIAKDGIVSYIFNNGEVEKLDEPIRSQVKALKRNQIELKSKATIKELVNSFTSGLVSGSVPALGEFLDGAFGSTPEVCLDSVKSVFNSLKNYGKGE